MEKVKIISIVHDTPNVMHIRTEKPDGISFSPGQAADVAVAKPGWDSALRPFTFTSLPSDSFLEFFIKSYPSHNGVTEQISKLSPNDSLLIGDVFGDIAYDGEGIFIAGGAGITPFISIFKDLDSKKMVQNNKLIFANNTEKDIIDKDFFSILLGKNFINVLSKEENDQYEHGYITKELIAQNIKAESKFYLCGPPPMMDAVLKHLADLGIQDSNIIKEVY